MASALRPQPHRGDQVAAGVVGLTTAIWLIDARFADSWGDFAQLLVTGLAAAFVLALAVQSPMEDEGPRPYQSAIFLSAIALLLLALARLAEVLGADSPLGTAGSLVWITLLLAALAGWFAVERNSAICTLVGLVIFGVTAVAFLYWVSDPGARDVRGVLLALTFAYGFGAVTQRDRRPLHGVGFVDAAGLAALAIALTFALEVLLLLIFGERGASSDLKQPGAAWELFLLAVGFGLCAYSAIDRFRGPGYLGVTILLAFVTLSGPDGNLIGWPLLLLLASGALLVVGLRPTQPLPPSPDAGAPPAPAQPLQ